MTLFACWPKLLHLLPCRSQILLIGNHHKLFLLAATC